jgi:hypothetical protein
VKYRNVPVGKDELKRLIVESGRAVQLEKSRGSALPQAQAVVDKQAREIEAKLSQVALQRVKLLDAKRMIELNQDVSKLGEVMNQTNDLLDKTDATADFGKIEVKAADFLPTAKETQDDDEFTRLLAGPPK